MRWGLVPTHNRRFMRFERPDRPIDEIFAFCLTSLYTFSEPKSRTFVRPKSFQENVFIVNIILRTLLY